MSAGRGGQWMAPERVGEFQIKGVLGAGGMGVVFLAQQTTPRREVALKVMKDGLRSPRLRRRFAAEAEALGRLRHPHIAQIFGSGVHFEAGTEEEPLEVPYYAMEYVPNAKTLVRFAREAALTLPARVSLFVKVCRALHHAHQRGLVHRDIKPGNVLVEPNGEPKIIDFGVARDVRDAAAGAGGVGGAVTANTLPGQFVGTLMYMSPEQVAIGLGGADAESVDHRSDVYSLGVVLYELLRNRLPYAIDNVPTLKLPEVIRSEPAVRPTGEDAGFPRSLETILMTALHKERGRRYQTAAELADDLERFLDNRPIRASGDSVWYLLSVRARALVADHAGLALAAAWVLSAAVGGLIAAPWAWPETSALWLQRAAWSARAGRDEPTPAAAFEHVGIIVLSERSDVAGMAARERLAGVDPADPVSRRALDARLLERLARAGPRAIAWDITYAGDAAADPLIARAAELRFANTGVVLATDSWSLDPSGRPPRISAALSGGGVVGGGVRFGTILIGDDEDGHWYVQLASGPADSAARGLALETFAVARHPAGTAVAQVDLAGERVTLRTRDQGWGWFAPPPVLIPAITQVEEQANESAGVRAGDVVGMRQAALPSDTAIERAVTDYQAVMEADEATLRRWFGGKVVVVGALRPDARGQVDRHPYADGRNAPGWAGHATALEELLTHFDVAAPASAAGLGTLAAGAPAMVLGWRARSRVMRWAGWAALTAAAAAGCVAAVWLSGVVVNPIGLSLGMLGSVWAASLVRRCRPARFG